MKDFLIAILNCQGKFIGTEENGMKNNVRVIGKRRKIRRKIMAAGIILGLTLPGKAVRAEEAPFVDVSTDLISLSPQCADVKMNVAVRNLPEGTKLVFLVADSAICKVEWAEGNAREYTQLCYKRGEMLGETTVTIFVEDHPEFARQIRVINREAADSYTYEGDGSLDIFGLNMPPIPYEAYAVSADEDGYFGLVWKNTAGERKVLVNKAGAYNGKVALGKGEEGVSLEILATGHWKITMTPVLTAATPTQSGTGNVVSGLFRGDNKKHNVHCANWADKGNFIVWLYDVNDNTKKLLANGAGTYGKNKGDVYLDAAHSYYLSVESAGSWLVEFSER